MTDKKSIVNIVFVCTLAGFIAGFLAPIPKNRVISAFNQSDIIIAGLFQTIAPTPRVHPLTPIPQQRAASPTRLIIPSLDVDTAIEPVGLDEQKRMGIPQNVYNAGWYALGTKPGEQGNAVLDGHVNTPSLQPSIFAHLKTMEPGDVIEVLDENGKQWDFRVRDVQDYETDTFPIELIFGPTNKYRLNLITCSGTYEQNRHDFTKRTVVFADLAK